MTTDIKSCKCTQDKLKSLEEGKCSFNLMRKYLDRTITALNCERYMRQEDKSVYVTTDACTLSFHPLHVAAGRLSVGDIFCHKILDLDDGCF